MTFGYDHYNESKPKPLAEFRNPSDKKRQLNIGNEYTLLNETAQEVKYTSGGGGASFCHFGGAWVLSFSLHERKRIRVSASMPKVLGVIGLLLGYN
eukprot:4353511-Amphidinium_carterae.1